MPWPSPKDSRQATAEQVNRYFNLTDPSTHQDLLTIGNQSRPKIFDLNIRRPSPLYSDVLEIDERVTLVGYTSDPNAGDHAIKFDDNGKLIKGYTGPGSGEHGQADGPGEIVRGLSGEAIRILKKPGLFSPLDLSYSSPDAK